MPSYFKAKFILAINDEWTWNCLLDGCKQRDWSFAGPCQWLVYGDAYDDCTLSQEDDLWRSYDKRIRGLLRPQLSLVYDALRDLAKSAEWSFWQRFLTGEWIVQVSICRLLWILRAGHLPGSQLYGRLPWRWACAESCPHDEEYWRNSAW